MQSLEQHECRGSTGFSVLQLVGIYQLISASPLSSHCSQTLVTKMLPCYFPWGHLG